MKENEEGRGDSQLAELLEGIISIVKSKTGQDLGSYKQSTVLRRIERRMGTNNIASLSEYRVFLADNPQEVRDLCQDILIGVTSFFRDTEAFAALDREILPMIFSDRDTDEPVRIWHAGCATGEEVYSTAIMIREYLEENHLPHQAQIFATDLDAEAIAQARAGFYPTELAASVGEKRLQAYFHCREGQCRIDKSVREMIVFAHHDLLKDPPFSHLDLIVCRNFLIYLTPEMQNRIIALFYQALKPERFLFLGSAETVGKYTDLFTPLDKKWRIFLRQDAGPRPETLFHFSPSLTRPSALINFSKNSGDNSGPGSVAEKLLIERYSPPCVVVNEKHDVVYVSSGKTGRFLEVPVGEPTRDVLKMVRKNLRPLLRTAIHKAFSERKQVAFRGIQTTGDGKYGSLNLLVEPLNASPTTRHLAMVVFEPAPPAVSTALPAKNARELPRDVSSLDELVLHLEDQLRITQEQLQATVEQLETSNEGFMATNEELIAINEEFQSTNEELQSTNEELETSKEELQAFNEEQATINAELQKKVEELDRANADMENLFASSGVATIFLDSQLTIQRFSPAMAGIFKLIPADIGRPFQRLAAGLEWTGFAADAELVLETWAPTEREVGGLGGGRHYLMRILPYRTSQGKVDGIIATFVDITERKRVEETLFQSERALRDAQQAARIGTYIYDIPANRWSSSSVLDRIFNIDAAYPRSSAGWAQLIHPDHREKLLAYLENCVSGHHRFDIEYRIIRQNDGEERWVLGLGEIEYAPDGTPLRMVGTIQDITPRKTAEEELQLRNRAIEASNNGIAICDARKNAFPILYVNPAFERITGYRAETVLGRKPYFLTPQNLKQKELVDLLSALRRLEEIEVELRLCRQDGTPFWSRLSMSPVRDSRGRVSHYVAIFDDITERKGYEQRLEYQASHDALTGLANRHLLTDRLEQSLIYANRSQRIVGVLLLDLDRFKVVNDTLGHGQGDELLRMVADRLTGCVRAGDTVSRLGGDEFLVALAEVAEFDDVGLMAKRIRDKLAVPFPLAAHELRVTASMGISLYPKDGQDVDTLICHADIAMYRSKEEGGDTFRFFAQEMNQRVQGTLKLEADLRQALERKEFLLHYQPKVDIASGRIIGCEALVRWQPPDRGPVSPGAFIPLAEETGLIVPLGAWVLQEACTQARTWQDAGLPFGKVAVNLSARQFRQSGLIDEVRCALEKAGLEPAALELEITESMIMHDPARAAETMRQLRDLGIGLCLDDFGTGYSSLNYLRRFPVDYLKIDRSFIFDATTDPSGAAVARSIVAIAHSLGIGAVAEGVESWAQFDFLAESRCDALQGFLFSRPLEPLAFTHMLSEGRTLGREADA